MELALFSEVMVECNMVLSTEPSFEGWEMRYDIIMLQIGTIQNERPHMFGVKMFPLSL